MEEIKIDQNVYKDFYKCITSLQAIAILTVIIEHWTHRVGLRPSLIWFLIYNIGEFGLVIFIFLSGFLLNMKLTLSKPNNFSWLNWYEKRMLRIYPLFIISTLIILLLLLFVKGFVSSINIYLIHMSGFQSIPVGPTFYAINYHTWYITLIITCYIVFPLFHYLIKKNFKIALISIIILYINFIIFFTLFYEVSSEIIHLLTKQDLKLLYFIRYIPNLFIFFFGMIFGHWVGESKMKNIELLRKLKIQLTSLISLIILFSLYIFLINTNIAGILNSFCYPLIGINLIIFGISFFKNKNWFNKILEIPGTNSYSLFLIHFIPIYIFYIIIEINLKKNFLDFWYITLPIIIIASILLSIPLTYVGDLISNSNEKYHDFIKIIVFSLVIYGIFSLILIIYENKFLNDILALIIFLSILSVVIFLFRKFKKK